ncbi:MAG: hypothetical protein RJA22_3072 [Verrucomicrobiota bacterium]|jgi:hypothetical protein
MIRNILTHIGGIENFGIISISLFFTVFIAMLVWACGRQRSYLDTMSALPLDPEAPPPARDPLPSTLATEARHE